MKTVGDAGGYCRDNNRSGYELLSIALDDRMPLSAPLWLFGILLSGELMRVVAVQPALIARKSRGDR